jgi:hypothetical protein
MFWKLDLFPSSGEGETPTLLGPLERAHLTHWTIHVRFTETCDKAITGRSAMKPCPKILQLMLREKYRNSFSNTKLLFQTGQSSETYTVSSIGSPYPFCGVGLKPP